VLDSLKRLRMPLIRYPGGNFVSGYRWRDGIGPRENRTPRTELAWHTVESNRFGTDEFVHWCKKLGTEPYMVVNCGDGTQREAQDWVEYCNGTGDTEPVRLRRANGYDEPHNVKYWGIGNEVYGHLQIGYKTPQEYARQCTEYAKVMKWVDPSIKTIASAFIGGPGWKEHTELLVEQAGADIDYLSIHWYVGNHENDFATYMATSEHVEEMLHAYEDHLSAVMFETKLKNKIGIAVDEWNVWFKTSVDQGLQEYYNLEDALVVAMQLMAILRHCKTVTMANIAQIVNVIAPVVTSPDGLFLQTIFYPFELMSRESGSVALDLATLCDTFQGGTRSGCPVLDVAGTFDPATRQVSLFVVNRTMDAVETELDLQGFGATDGKAYVVNGPNIKTENSFDNPIAVATSKSPFDVTRPVFTFEPHSFTTLCFTAN
jgi:alpha-L-arabinofuranosidase